MGRNRSSFDRFGRLPQQGFTDLELVIVIIIISTLISMLAVRLMPAIDEAERAAVLKIEGQLRSSLTMEAAGYVARGEFEQIRMVGMNPMRLMMDPPENYVGERETVAGVPRAHWVFATETQRLVYRPDLPRTQALSGIANQPFLLVRAFQAAPANGASGSPQRTSICQRKRGAA